MHNSSAMGNAAVARTNDTASLIIQSVNVSTDLGWYTLIVRDPATTYVLAAWLVKQARKRMPVVLHVPYDASASVPKCHAFVSSYK